MEVTEQDILAGLREVGLRPGNVVMVHSSLSRFGYVAGGAPAVVRALLAALGPEGTLVVPTFVRFFVGPPDQVFDRERTPSQMGAVSEAARLWPGARRSSHPGHPFAAIGPRAAEITERPCDFGWGRDSPLATLERLDARILLLGVDYNCVTLFHLPEFEAQVPYRRVNRYSGTLIVNGAARPVVMPSFDKLPGLAYDFLPFGRELEAAGLVQQTQVGASTVRLFDVRPALARERERLAADPLYLLSAESRQKFLAAR
jgi:aminoglycoside 3-N-acetyltransferase